ncbi:unnamed protein product [Lymnaea stagnalis]|uniref:Fucosyltransferase n=1 Tax=Lymnaea stagnalis TaxID=6523 RepID=A0AAV2H312_LYMST
MAVWLVSHCHTHSKREKYVRAMQKHISVDIYGRCGMTPKCSLGNGTGCSTAAILSEYKFYIAFENSFCADYVSEKFFKTYTGDNHVIPVVRGGARYDELLPNDTFVNADRFTSPKELALYLKTLAADPVSHGRVLERKDQYRVMPSANVFRDVCEAVASVNFEPKTYDIKQWMGEQCDTDPRTDV